MGDKEIEPEINPVNKLEASVNNIDIKESPEIVIQPLKENKSAELKTSNNPKWDKKLWLKNNSKWLIPLILISVIILTSTYLRMIPDKIPVVDLNVESLVLNAYKKEIAKEVAGNYPTLSSQQRDSIVEKELAKIPKEEIDASIEETTKTFKNNYKDPDGNTYLIDPDTFLWFSQARNVIRHGHLGDKIVDGKSVNTLRDGRLDKETTFQLHPYFAAYTYKFISIFKQDISLQRVMFLLSIYWIALSVIPAFFIGRRIAGNIGGFFAAMLLAINFSLLSRTMGGFADTDSYNVLFPLLIAWLLIESYYAKNLLKKLILRALSGFLVGVYSATWIGGWSFIFFVMIGVILMAAALSLAMNLKKNQYRFSSSLLKESKVKSLILILILFIVSSGVFISIINSFETFLNVIGYSYRQFTNLGASEIWPGVQITVAEFKKVGFFNFVNEFGKFSLLAAIAGIFITFPIRKKDNKDFLYFSLLMVWTAASVYFFLSKGSRFIILVVPPLVIAIGAVFGLAYRTLNHWLNENTNFDEKVNSVLVCILFLLFLIMPMAATLNRTTSAASFNIMDDTWYETLMAVKNDSNDSIITSWWDFGHIFTAIGERRVTMDGGDQKKRVHWVGKILLTEDEQEAVGILRMLNCGQERATEVLDEITKDSLETVNILYSIFKIPDKDQAFSKYLELGLTEEQAKSLLKYTHCEDLIANYFITSEDMVKKSAAWSHFGSWDFEKASMYYFTKNLASKEAVSYLIENYNLTKDKAQVRVYDLRTGNIDFWIGPSYWYYDELKSCSFSSNSTINCFFNTEEGRLSFVIDINNFEAYVDANHEFKPKSLTYSDGQEIIHKRFSGKTLDHSVILVKEQGEYKFIIADSDLTKSLFTKLFFFHGAETKCFEEFYFKRQITGEKIITWKVDYSCQQ